MQTHRLFRNRARLQQQRVEEYCARASAAPTRPQANYWVSKAAHAYALRKQALLAARKAR